MIENPYLALPRLKAALRMLDIRPSRGMGQNFLIDPVALAAIVQAADLAPDQTVIEVGPGFGVLTWELLRRAGQVVAVELDKRLVERLHEEFAAATNLSILQSDILKVQPEELLGLPTNDERRTTDTSTYQADPTVQYGTAEPSSSVLRPPSYKVVANLPYAITSPALRHFLEAAHKPDLMVVLVQWEVGLRIAGQVGDLSMLAHAIQIYAEPEVVARVPASSFYPAPAVDSAVLRLRVRPHPAVDVEVESLMRIMKAGFLHARKTLSNALPGGLAAMGRPTTRERVLAALSAAGVDPQRRAETVTLAEWVAIYHNLT